MNAPPLAAQTPAVQSPDAQSKLAPHVAPVGQPVPPGAAVEQAGGWQRPLLPQIFERQSLGEAHAKPFEHVGEQVVPHPFPVMLMFWGSSILRLHCSPFATSVMKMPPALFPVITSPCAKLHCVGSGAGKCTSGDWTG